MPDKPPVKLADVAREAGVSLATASRAMSESPLVAAATRDRVRAEARRLGFVALPDASRLARGVTGRVAVLVPHVSRWFFGALLEGAEEVLSGAGFDLLVYPVGGPADRGQFFERLPLRRNVDAVLVFAMPLTAEEHERLDLIGVEIVAAGGQVATFPHVSIDDRLAARQAVGHLIGLGHRRIAMIAAVDPMHPDSPIPAGRSDGYFSILAEAGIEAEEQYVTTVPWGGEEGSQAMAQLLTLIDLPTAVYAHSDEVALGAVRTIRRAGLRIPEDISVVGIDDHPLAALTDLTTVRQPVHAQGERAARMLLSAINNEPFEHSVLLPTELVVRRSTAPPRNLR